MIGGMISMAGDAAGSLHLAFVDDASPGQLRYSWRR
jgi:hypothetical protein